ncbi:MAG: FAD-dependent oxidoreductase [Anaerolineae bacterium]|nr:FAD-dependent oxidoreductase [Anaerolineae bacterium]
MDSYTYVIVGGGLAGGRACQGIRRNDKQGSIALVSAETHLPYERPPLSKGYLRGKEGREKLWVKDEAYYAQNGIDLILDMLAARLDPADHTLTLGDGRVLGYQKLLLATGGSAWRLPIPGSELERVYTLRTIEDSDAIREAATSAKQALVIGGSFIGCEVSATLTQMGVGVTTVFLESRPMERVAPEAFSALVQARFEREGIRLLPQTKPLRIEGAGRAERVALENGETLDVDLVVMGVGIRLNTALAREAGLEMAERDAVMVNRHLQTSAPDIYAAGDIAAWPSTQFGRLRVEHWDVARAQGYRAGRNMAGDMGPYVTLPYFFTDLFDISPEVWGDLSAWDTVVQRGSTDAGSYAFYYFSEGQLTGVLAAGRPDAERDAMQSLVRTRPAYEDVADKLSDETVELGVLT